MERKPQDILEFLRRKPEQRGPSAPTEGPPPEDGLESTPRLLLVRKSQIVVAGLIAGLSLVLAFLIGMAFGGGDEAPAPATETLGPWVIRAISYDNDAQGRATAKNVQEQLSALGHEVTIQTLAGQSNVVVTVGAWVQNPQRSEKARRLLQEIQAITEKKKPKKTPFRSAYFWQIRR